ncbi:energy-coupling factor transporter transmembrane protein EcfT [Clostridium sporogenes]|uniref:energy-coupling factor transporter transmembrane component T n=1 Tax=Clostridium sporogenes TaxID=1509 RepID=UPI00214A31B5|nr:energy-coupling factor transporter transmembrane component T [Clostridium sporogenes]MCR1972594.1 energy-coupling factor transporter transmembrane protein EcfT [Clostridium sporogenes]
MKAQTLQQKQYHLDPRTKLFLMAVISTAEFLYSHVAFMIAVALIPFVLLMINKQYKLGTGFIILFVLSLVAKEVQSYIHLNVVLNMIIVLLVGLVLRLFPAFAMGAYIIYSTKASEFISAMGRMHITRKITIPVSVLFRFLPTMREESGAIKDAMRMREIQFCTKKFWKNPLALIEYRFIPLMISTVKIGEELSAAALTRGLDNPVIRTNTTKVGFTVYDFVTLCVSTIVLLVSFFILK